MPKAPLSSSEVKASNYYCKIYVEDKIANNTTQIKAIKVENLFHNAVFILTRCRGNPIKIQLLWSLKTYTAQLVHVRAHTFSNDELFLFIGLQNYFSTFLVSGYKYYDWKVQCLHTISGSSQQG